MELEGRMNDRFVKDDSEWFGKCHYVGAAMSYCRSQQVTIGNEALVFRVIGLLVTVFFVSYVLYAGVWHHASASNCSKYTLHRTQTHNLKLDFSHLLL